MAIDQSRMMTEFSARSGEAALFVRSIGGQAGDSVVLALHGGPGLSHDYLLPLLEQLATPLLRVVTYDQRGVGRSTGVAASGEPLQEWATDLEAVRLAVGAERVHLLAHSGGGFVAIAYAGRYPQRTASITFIDSVSPTARGLRAAFGRFERRIAALQNAGLIPSPLPEEATEWLRAIMPAYFTNPLQPNINDLNGAVFNAAAHHALMRALGDYDLRPRLAGLTMPILSYVAETPFGSAMAGELTEALPQANLRRSALGDYGHLPWVEAPEPFVRDIETFLHGLIRRG